jgi:hypothetical protein
MFNCKDLKGFVGGAKKFLALLAPTWRPLRLKFVDASTSSAELPNDERIATQLAINRITEVGIKKK